MPRTSQKQSRSIHRPELVARLHEAIRRKHVTVREVKVRKPVELHLKAEDECAICLDPLTEKNIAVTPCGHKFCFSCIAENLNVSKTCPMCRERIAPDAKKKEISDNDFADIVYQNFDEAADIVSWSAQQSPDQSSIDSDSEDWPDEPAPLRRTNELSGAPVIDEDNSLPPPPTHPEDSNMSDSSSAYGHDDDDDDDDEYDDDSSVDSFSEQHNALVQEFANEHLTGLSQEETLTKINEFSKMLSFAMHIASDVVDFYEK